MYNIGRMENINTHDPSYSPIEACEASDIPLCSKCADSGVIELGEDVRSTEFCDCDTGEDTFHDMADGEQAYAQYGLDEPEWY